MFETSNMFRKLKSVVVFLKIIVSFVLTRPFGKINIYVIFYFPHRESVKGEGFTWDCRESGVCIKFSPKAVPEAKLITCSLWRPSAVSLPLQADESLVSSVIQLACDDPVGVNFSGVTLALSHSAVDMGGYELVMKELTDPENDTWKDLNTTNITWDPSGILHIIALNNLKTTTVKLSASIVQVKQLEISNRLIRPSKGRHCIHCTL